MNVTSPVVYAYDMDGDALTQSLVNNVAHGTLDLHADGTFRYTPTAGFTGSDSFSLKYVDSLGAESSELAFTINVGNSTPYAYANTTWFTVAHDHTLNVTSPVVYAYDMDGDALTQSLVSNVAHGTLGLHADGTFQYTPTVGYVGGDSFSLKYVDSLGAASGDLTFTISVGNNAPYAYAYNTGFTVAGNDTLNVTMPVAYAYDMDGDALTTTITSNVAHGTLSLQNNGTFQYTPATDYAGADGFTFHFADPLSASSSDITVSLNVTAPNTPPSLSNLNFTLASLADGTCSGTLTGRLDDGSTMSSYYLQFDHNPGDNIETINAWASGPNADFSTWLSVPVGTVTVLARAVEYDSNGATMYGDWTAVNVNAVNTPPVFDAPATGGMGSSPAAAPSANAYMANAPGSRPTITANWAENSTGVVMRVGANDNDPGDRVDRIYAITSDTSGAFEIATDGTITCMYGLDYEQLTAGGGGPPIFTITVAATDTNGATSYADVDIKIGDVNDVAPTAGDDGEYFDFATASTRFSVDSTTGVLANDSDTDTLHEDLTAILQTQPLNGWVDLNADGSFTYTLENTSFAGDESFTYKVSDGVNLSGVATVTIQVAQLKIKDGDDFPFDGIIANDVTGHSTTTTDGKQNYLRLELQNDHGHAIEDVSWTLPGSRPGRIWI